jgi:hypothetical protein
MRLLKLVLTALVAVLAVLAGLFVAAIAAITGAALLFFGRSRRKQPPDRAATLPHAAKVRAPNAGDSDVIDVVATEVPADPAPRQHPT